MRCTAMTTRGERCREQRLGWLWVVERDPGKLRCLCRAHMTPQDERQRRLVSATALSHWMVYGGDAR